ncbi:MAG: hypothetical protein QM736_12110 [Vicinamibacterales bacterium]
MRLPGVVINCFAMFAVVVPVTMPSCEPPDPPVKVEFYRAGSYSFSWRERRAIERVAMQATVDAHAVLPTLPRSLVLKVRAGSNVIPETGEASNAMSPNVIWWDVDPRHDGGVRATVNRELRPSLYHAFHHLVRGNAGIGRGFRDTIVGEGMAIAFERDFARSARPWGQYSEADTSRVGEVLSMPDDAAWGAWLKADRQGRRWAGQRVGTYVVDRASRAMRLNAAQMAAVPTEDVIRHAGYEPAAVR